MEITKAFVKNAKAFNDKCPLIINQGGTSSSKTYSILQILYLIAKTRQAKLIISVVSYSLPHLKLGAMRDFDQILIADDVIIDDVKNKTDLYYRIGNSIIEFFSADNVAKVHGPRRDILYINECNFIKSYETYDQLVIRTRSTVFLDFNPTLEFWVHTDVIPNEEHVLIKTTYLDNHLLDKNIVKRIESKKNNEGWWKVYGLGELGQLQGAIYSNWHYGEFDDSLPYGYGLDFGVLDPDALIKVAIDTKRKILYADEQLYKSDLSTDQLGTIIKSRVRDREMIMADSASKRTIGDLRKLGLNIKPVRKGAGSIIEGIRIVQNYELIITENSYNLQKELNNYIWVDRKGGVPCDDFNHLLDALRYYVMTVTKKSGIRSSGLVKN